MARVAGGRRARGGKRPAVGGAAPVAGPSGGGAVLGYHFPEWGGPPPGTYDPGLEAEVRASQRGLLDLIEQAHREGHRQHVDVRQKDRELHRKLVQGRGDIGRNRGYAQADAAYAHGQLQTSFQRDIEDLAIAKQRGGEAYDRTLTDLQHKYSTLEQSEQSRATQQGTAEVGSQQASAAVRIANQGHDVGEVSRQHREDEEDLARREGRVRQDFATQSGHLDEGLGRRLTAYDIQRRRLGQEYHGSRHAVSLAALRATQDRATKLSHAKREQAIYSQDLAEQAYYQAHQLNPSIVFPTPSAAGGGPAHSPHVNNPQPRPVGIGGGRAISYPGRKPTRRPRWY